MKHQINKSAVCPYYRHEAPQVIYCDGVQEGSVIHLAFSSRSEAALYKRKYCRRNYKSCRISKLLEEAENE